MALPIRAQTALAEDWSVLSLFCGSVGREDRIQIFKLSGQVPLPLSHLTGPLAYVCGVCERGCSCTGAEATDQYPVSSSFTSCLLF